MGPNLSHRCIMLTLINISLCHVSMLLKLKVKYITKSNT